jgi:hypothetical protein
MGCELVYYVVPRESAARTYAELAWIHDPASAHLRATDQSMALTGRSDQDDSR